MKKLGVIAVLLMVGVGFAYASSMSIPWFIDKNTLTNVGLPSTLKGTEGVCYLHNNQSVDVTCSIDYFSANGTELGPSPTDPGGNSFTIPSRATVAFRPCANDPASAGSGQEQSVALTIPNRPFRTDLLATDPTAATFNGSAVISWIGGTQDVQGMYTEWHTLEDNGRVVAFGTLLPPGT